MQMGSEEGVASRGDRVTKEDFVGLRNCHNQRMRGRTPERQRRSFKDQWHHSIMASRQ